MFIVGVLELVPNALLRISEQFIRAQMLLAQYNAVLVWSTTYPICLSKYHLSEGWQLGTV